MTQPTYKEFVSGLFNRSGSHAQDFAHAVLGLCTEVYELDHASGHTNAVEELGDLAFYDQALQAVVSDAFVVDLDNVAFQTAGDLLVGNPNWNPTSHLELKEIPSETAARVRAFFLCELQDIAKRWIGYGKTPTEEKAMEAVSMAVAVLDLSLTLIGDAGPGTREHTDLALLAIAANRDKLQARYKGLKFSVDAAINRDLSNEAKVLDAAVAASS